ncbi:MAG: Gfo/Idh/MocA family protein [Planctomycetota bacterium]
MAAYDLISPLPDIDLRPLLELTDDTGVLCERGAGRDRPAYDLEDNAIALMASVLYHALRGGAGGHVPMYRYLAFVGYAFDGERGRFRSAMGHDRRWVDRMGGEDAHARTLWALGLTAVLAPAENMRSLALRLFDIALPAIRSSPYLHSWAYALLGVDNVLRAVPDHDAAGQLRKRFAGEMLDIYRTMSDARWRWWEDAISYDSARLPQTLVVTGAAMDDTAMVKAGLASLEWLIELQTAADGHPSLIGNDGWMNRKGSRAQYDQEPGEAAALVGACLAAARVTRDDTWYARARWAFSWFHGNNDHRTSLIDPASGACAHHLGERGPSAEIGARASLQYMHALPELPRFRTDRQVGATVVAPRSLGLGVVGASRIASLALTCYREIGELDPVSVCSSDPERAHAFAEAHHLGGTASFEEMLADERIDLVYVAGVPDTHAPRAIAALQAGKHVFCEKPLALNRADAHRVAEAAAARDRRLGVDMVLRYGPLYASVEAIVRSRLLGAVLRVQVTDCGDDEGMPREHWFWDPARSGGIFIEHAIDYFDLVRAWLGEGFVESAQRIRRPGTTRVDQALCAVSIPPQTTVGYYHGLHQSRHLQRNQIRIICESGEIAVGGWMGDRLELEALLDAESIERLRGLLPEDSTVEQGVRPSGSRSGSRRSGRVPIDAVVRARWEDPAPAEVVHQRALRAAMADFLNTITRSNHRPRVDLTDSIRALEYACDADWLAREVRS